MAATKKKAKKAENFTPKKCKFCGKIFIPTSRSQRYCDETCRNNFNYAERKSVRSEYNKSIEAASEIDPYIPKDKPNEGLVNIAVEARKAGMSYGQYVLYLQTHRKKENKAW